MSKESSFGKQYIAIKEIQLTIVRKARNPDWVRGMSQSRSCKGWFPYDRKRSQTIADRRRSRIVDRRRSLRDLFPYNRRRSQTIAEPTVAIHFVQRKCHMYSRVVLAGKSKQTTWRTSRRKFCCKQIYFFF